MIKKVIENDKYVNRHGGSGCGGQREGAVGTHIEGNEFIGELDKSVSDL